MIPQEAVKGFLQSRRDDHRWMKSLDKDELLQAIDGLRPRPSLDPRLKKHQLASFLLGVAHPRFAFWLDMGLGKSVISLELLKYWRQCGRLRRALIFVLSDKAFLTWKSQIDKFNIGIPHVMLEGSSIEKWSQLERFGDGLVIVSYPGAVAMVSELRKDKKGGRKVRKLEPGLVSRLVDGVDAIILDESTRCGNRVSLSTKLCIKLSEEVEFLYLLAGIPFGRDPTLVWAQQLMVDGGESFGGTLGLFRAAFCSEEDNPWGNEWSRNYTFKKSSMPEFTRLLQHRSIMYETRECLDLPKLVPILEEIDLPSEASAYYRLMLKNARDMKGDFRALENVFVRMRQLSSGFIGVKNDETGERADIEFGSNPKLERFLDIVEGLPQGAKLVCFYEFTWSGRKLVEALGRIGVKSIWLWSGTKDSTREQLRFTKGDCTVAIINHRVGAYSIDGLQDVCNYLCFYESPVSVIARRQAEARIMRQGQVSTVFQYDLVVKGTQDARILDFHREGQDLLAETRKGNFG